MAFPPQQRFEWQLRTRSLPLGERTLLMAIVNLTPDSFSGDGVAASGAGVEAGIQAAVDAVDGGADILDLGAESTRPDATPLSADEEQSRLLPVLEGLMRRKAEAVVSVDTYHAATARAAAAAGAEIVNDVSGLLWDGDMAATVAETGCGLVLMHTRGRPTEWHSLPGLKDDEVVPLVKEGLHERLIATAKAGIPQGKIVLDPGFGFGKMGEANFRLLAGLNSFHELGRPLLIGLSRKGFLGEAIRAVQHRQTNPGADRRAATLAANVAAVMSGAHILRVHDLQITREALAVTNSLITSH